MRVALPITTMPAAPLLRIVELAMYSSPPPVRSSVMPRAFPPKTAVNQDVLDEDFAAGRGRRRR